MAEVQPADPRARRVVLIVFAVALVCGAILLWAFDRAQPEVARWLREDPATLKDKARVLLLVVAGLMAGPPAAAGAYLWRFGARVVKDERFPPAGVRMVQDTVVLTGDAARRRGRLAQGFGVMLMLASGALVVLLWRLAPR